jgi:hypothetical protein
MEKQGIIYVKVALYLEADADEEEVQEIVSEMDYEFRHPMIQETKIQEVE